MWSPLWSILICKIPQFDQKLPIRTIRHAFLESRHPEVTKNPYYLLSPEWSQKKVSAHGLLWKIKISRKVLKYQHRENPQNNPRNLSERKIAKINSVNISDYKGFFVITS